MKSFYVELQILKSTDKDTKKNLFKHQNYSGFVENGIWVILHYTKVTSDTLHSIAELMNPEMQMTIVLPDHTRRQGEK